MLTIKITTDNAAFQDDVAHEDEHEVHRLAKREECARLLREIADKLTQEHEPVIGGTIRDRNGNKVGTWVLE